MLGTSPQVTHVQDFPKRHPAGRRRYTRVNIFNLGTDEYCEVNDRSADQRAAACRRNEAAGEWDGSGTALHLLDCSRTRSLGWHRG
jgi:hypothetical protein